MWRAKGQTNIVVNNPAGISPATLRRWARQARRRLRLTGDINIITVSPVISRQLNTRYRHRHRATNVLTFNYAPRRTRAMTADERGEIILCPAVIHQEASSQRQSYRSYLRQIMQHGLIHLTGRDHRTKLEQHRWDKIANSLL